MTCPLFLNLEIRIMIKTLKNPDINERLRWLNDPELVSVGRTEAHSDHAFYLSKEGYLFSTQDGRECLNGSWHFSWSRRPEEGDTEFFREDRPLDMLDCIPVPGHWELNGYGHPHYTNSTYPWDGSEALTPPAIPREYNPTGRYLTDWQMPSTWEGRRIRMVFHGAESALFLWVNGQFAGYSEDSFTPAEFDITELVHSGVNRLAVEVVRYCSGSWLEDQDFFRFGGIFRDVEILALPEVHIEDLFVRTIFKEDDLSCAWVEVSGRLSGSDRAIRLGANLRDRRQTIITTSEWNRDRNVDKEAFSFSLQVKDPHLWSGEDPYLYQLHLHVIGEDETLLESVIQPLGIRSVCIRDGVFLLNGKRIIFRGVNRHEFSDRTGRVISEEEMCWDIRFLKENHVNAVRTCHYPNVRRWYELCDEYGIYLIDETNMETHGTWSKANSNGPSVNVPGSLPEWKKAAVDRACSMLERDKNHPSILLWSCGNESYGGENLRHMTDFFHRRDPGRPVHYEGICHCREFEDVSDVESRMYLPPAGVREYLAHRYKKPLISCEYMHAMGNSLGGMKYYIDLEKYPSFAGGFIWDYMDQALWTNGADGTEKLGYGGDFADRPHAGNFSGDGILFAGRRISPKVCEMKALYAPLFVDVREDGVEIFNRNFFTDSSVYRYAAEVYADGILQETYELQLPVIAPQEKAFIPWEEALNIKILEKQPSWTKQSSGLRGGQENETESDQESGPEMVVRVCVRRTGEESEEISFGEFIRQRIHGAKKKSVAESGFRVIEGDDTIGAAGKDFLVRFPIQEESAVSLQKDGREYLLSTPVVTFWRALTDNERGTHASYRLAAWKMADYGKMQKDCRWENGGDYLRITYTYVLPGIKDSKVMISYRVESDGEILVTLDWPGCKDMPEFPALGMVFRLPRAYDRVTCYGMGPQENYVDRCHGVRLGSFETTAADSFSPYLKPQECGNHTGVRSLTVCDSMGYGLVFSAENEPFEASVLPWSAQQLEDALHAEELPAPSATWVRILAVNAGVGGIDSWGSKAEEEYLPDASVPRRLTFTIQMI